MKLTDIECPTCGADSHAVAPDGTVCLDTSSEMQSLEESDRTVRGTCENDHEFVVFLEER